MNTSTAYKPLIVGIDDPMFPALADPTDRWNGFLGTPWFDRQVAQDVADWANPDGFVRITVTDEGVWYANLEWADEYDDPRGELCKWTTEIDGTPRATIGAWEWCWSEWPADTLTHFCCGGCGRELPLSEGVDQTRPGLDPVPVYVCAACAAPTSSVVEVKIEDRGMYGIRRTVVCSCGLETIQRAMDAEGNLCGRCGYLSDHA